MHMIPWSAAACMPLACMALAATAGAQVACPGAQQPPTIRTVATARAATLCLINRERAMQRLAPVREAPVVSWTAQTHSALMVSWQVFAHATGVADRLTGLYWLFGQNLAWGEGGDATPERIVAAWMTSPAHRANILTPEFGDVGIGIVTGAPEPHRLPAATYTTDFGAAIDEPFVEEAALQPPIEQIPVARPKPRMSCRAVTRGKRLSRSAAKRRRAACSRLLRGPTITPS